MGFFFNIRYSLLHILEVYAHEYQRERERERERDGA